MDNKHLRNPACPSPIIESCLRAITYSDNESGMTNCSLKDNKLSFSKSETLGNLNNTSSRRQKLSSELSILRAKFLCTGRILCFKYVIISLEYGHKPCCLINSALDTPAS